MKLVDGVPLQLTGSPAERGAAQARARPDLVDAVRAAAVRRRAEIAFARRHASVRDYLDRQAAFAHAHCAPEMAEVEGIAHGFGLSAPDLFDGLHAGAAADLAAAEGCTAWAAPWAAGAIDGGAVVAKNRDIRAELLPLQEVMLHEDPVQPMRAVLCVGALGAPGAYSSGLNRAGLAVVDTAIRSRSYRVGWLRYFAMTRLLWACSTVDEAVEFLRSVPHTGGGSLVLGDRAGAVAAVEFPDGTAAVELRQLVTRTNHFTAPEAAPAPLAGDASEANSAARLRFLRAALDAGRAPQSSLDAAAGLMAAHGEAADEALCRHGEGRAVRTVSTAIYLTAARELIFAPDYPCRPGWRRYSMAAFAHLFEH